MSQGTTTRTAVKLDLQSQIPPHILPHILRLLDFRSRSLEHSIASFPAKFSSCPNPRLAAVLVLLYQGTDGNMRVLLTTRDKSLRSHPGQVALPGGKSDPEDGTPVVTALREAEEEVGLPLGHPSIHVLATLPAQISLYKYLVTPIVAYCSDPKSIIHKLRANPGEVEEIFDWRLDAFLDPSLVAGCRHEMKDVAWVGDTQWRKHKFTRPSTIHAKSSVYTTLPSESPAPIKGLTADILILTAQIAYGRPTVYERYAPRQPRSTDFSIEWVMLEAKRVGGFKTSMRQDFEVVMQMRPAQSPAPRESATLFPMDRRMSTPILSR